MSSQGVQSLGLIVALLVPGGLFLWSYERKSSSYRRRDLKDRVVRLAAASVILLTITAPVAWYAYIQFWQGLISGGADYAWMWHHWLAACGYLAAVVFILGPLAATINQRLRSHLRLSDDEINRRQSLLRWVALKVLEVRPNPNAFEFLLSYGQGGLYIGADVIESAQIIRDYEGDSNGSDTR